MTTNSEPAVVLVTTVIDDREKAEAIARELVDAHAAACVQIGGPVTSVYRWEGAVEDAQEWSVAAKTTAQNAAAVVDQIRQLHSYDVPEILVTPVLGGHVPYLEWVAAETSVTPSS